MARWALEDGEPRWFVLAYQGGDLTLLIDGQCAARARAALDGDGDVAAGLLLGAGYPNYYQGSMQQLNVLRWMPTTGHSEN